MLYVGVAGGEARLIVTLNCSYYFFGRIHFGNNNYPNIFCCNYLFKYYFPLLECLLSFFLLKIILWIKPNGRQYLAQNQMLTTATKNERREGITLPQQ